mmetsp:Transcript_5588/g.10515  ORF Transcript_5588/g.10515 Transcript_5588/m.10515 type:complete len:225 (-) Transcript_5588:1115-1789(-)
MGLSILLLKLFVLNKTTLIEIKQKNVSGLETTLANNVLRIDIHDTNLTCHDNTTALSDIVPTGTKTIPIKSSTKITTISEGHERGTIPRLHDGAVVVVKVLLVLGHVRIVLPSLGNEHHHNFGKITTRTGKKLQNRVESTGIRRVYRDNRLQLLKSVLRKLEFSAVHNTLASTHPVGITTEGVNLTIVAQETHGLSTVPTGEGVGTKARMDKSHITAEIVAEKI